MVNTCAHRMATPHTNNWSSNICKLWIDFIAYANTSSCTRTLLSLLSLFSRSLSLFSRSPSHIHTPTHTIAHLKLRCGHVMYFAVWSGILAETATGRSPVFRVSNQQTQQR